MKKIFLSLIFAAAACAASAQAVHDNASGRQFYAEFGGGGVLFSANFDSRFIGDNALGLGYRVGIGFGVKSEDVFDTDGWDTRTRTYMTFPLGLNYVFGKSDSPHAFEVGAGVTILGEKLSVYNYRDDYSPGNFIGHFEFMYRHKPINGGFTWRIGFTPIIGTAGKIMPSGAVGVGYSF